MVSIDLRFRHFTCSCVREVALNRFSLCLNGLTDDLSSGRCVEDSSRALADLDCSIGSGVAGSGSQIRARSLRKSTHALWRFVTRVLQSVP